MIQLLKNSCTKIVTAMFRIDSQQVGNVTLKLLKRRIVARHTLNVDLLGEPFSAYAYIQIFCIQGTIQLLMQKERQVNLTDFQIN